MVPTKKASSPKQDNDLLLSGEALSCWPKEHYLRFLDDLDAFGFDVKVLALVRPLFLRFFAIQETPKSARHHPLIGLNRPHRTKDRHPENSNRSKQIEILQDVFGSRINFQPFSKAIAHPDGPIAFCLEQLDLPVAWSSLEHESSFRSNQSLNNLQARAINLFNQQLKLNSNRNKCSKSTFKLVRQGLETLEGGRFLLTKEEFSRSNAYKQLKQEMDVLGPSFAEESVQFADPIQDPQAIMECLAKCAALLAAQPNSNSPQKKAKAI